MKKAIHTLIYTLMFALVFSSSADAYRFGSKDDRNPADYEKRVQVADPTKDPYRSIVALYNRFDNSSIVEEHRRKEVCTGTVIGKDTVITAAHCIFGHEDTLFNGYATSGHGSPAQKDAVKPYGQFKVKSFKAHESYMDKNERKHYTHVNHDVAIITYEPNAKGQHIGDVVPPLKLKKVDKVAGQQIETAGYPADKSDDNTKRRQMWKTNDKVLLDHSTIVRGNNLAQGDFYSGGGQSGSAIRDKDNNIIGILVFGSKYETVFVKMTDDIYNWVTSNTNDIAK